MRPKPYDSSTGGQKIIAPQHISFVNATGSKDKRLTMLPD
jgi:hypothetical protein